MCGIAGYVHKSVCTDFCDDLGKKVQELQACRGPDNHTTTTFLNESWTTHFYHQHLRVADLNPLANQPMRSKTDHALSIILNGEIYNHAELRSEISRQPLTHSDTEVLIELLAQNGTAETLKKIRGMFAWATLNERTSEIELVRDRFGEKPLHLVKQEDAIFFSSQYDSATYFIKKMDSLKIDQMALGSYLTLGYVPYRQSLFKGIEKISPGGKFTLNLKRQDWSEEYQTRWIAPFEVKEVYEHTSGELEEVLRKSVKEQLEADVPVGLFLSGGVDSSLVSALAQQEHTQSMHSFSIGFEQKDFDESTFALGISQVLGTNHHARTMTANDAFLILDKVTSAYSEPLGDPSVFPTAFVSQFAREHVTVCLTGDGADELFFGYGRYARYQFLDESMDGSSKSTSFALKMAKSSPGLLNLFGSKGARLKGILSSDSPLQTYLPLVGFGHISKNYAKFNLSLESGIDELYLNRNLDKPSLNWMREFDIDTYLTDDILVKVDRAAMASSLETRAPFLDPRVVHIAQTLGELGTSRPSQKSILKNVIYQYAPSGQFDRKKQGFGAPLGEWFRTTLKEWGTAIIHETDWDSLELKSLEIEKLWAEIQKSDKTDATFEWLILSLGSSIARTKIL
jgi:asparagine synthase (glutamine-hydrolysing)